MDDNWDHMGRGQQDFFILKGQKKIGIICAAFLQVWDEYVNKLLKDRFLWIYCGSNFHYYVAPVSAGYQAKRFGPEISQDLHLLHCYDMFVTDHITIITSS